MSGLLLTAAVADLVAVAVHGGVGHRWLQAQLDAVNLPASALFGDPDVGRRVIWVSWHAVTAMFAVSAIALGLMALGSAAPSIPLLRFVAALHAAVLAVGAGFLLRRLDAIQRPIPPVFVACMATVVATCLLAG